jgi:hypothetical protein
MVGLRDLYGAAVGEGRYTLREWRTWERVLRGVGGGLQLFGTAAGISSMLSPCRSPRWGRSRLFCRVRFFLLVWLCPDVGPNRSLVTVSSLSHSVLKDQGTLLGMHEPSFATGCHRGYVPSSRWDWGLRRPGRTGRTVRTMGWFWKNFSSTRLSDRPPARPTMSQRILNP